MTVPEARTRSRAKRRSKKTKVSAARKFFLAMLTLLLTASLVTAGYLGYLYFYKINHVLDQVTTNEEVPAGQSAKVKPMGILLLGLDSRPETGSLNTDVIMAAALNPATNSATVVSIPRDTLIKSTMGLRSNKANAFYANLYVSDKDTAFANIKKVFGGVLDIPLDYVVRIDFNGFKDVIDALGGITVNVDQDMHYVDHADGTNIDLKKGVQKLNGKQALDFVRYRHSNHGETPESGDMDRNARQQQVVAKILEKLKTPSGMMKVSEVIEAVGNNMKTDMPKSQLKDFIRTYMGIDQDKIEYIHLQGEWKSPYVRITEADWDKARSALQTQLQAK